MIRRVMVNKGMIVKKITDKDVRRLLQRTREDLMAKGKRTKELPGLTAEARNWLFK